MTREIKFRAWDKERKQWLPHQCFHLEGKECIIEIGSEGNDFYLMQSTGLFDKNGKEIYEGDIITNVWGDFESMFEVKWDLYGFRLQSISDRFEMSKGEWRDCPTHMDLTEIIGNIYETPKLLTNNK